MIKKIILFILFSILLLLFFSPQILSNSVGRWALHKLADANGAQLKLESISLSWMGPQQIRQLHLSLNDGSTITADKIQLNGSLLSLATNQIPIVQLSASNVSADFLGGALQLRGMNISAEPEGSLYQLKVNGLTTSDNQQGKFSVETLVDPYTPEIRDVSGQVINLPLALIDKFFNTSISSVLGSTANISLSRQDNDNLVNINTPTLKGEFLIKLTPAEFEFRNKTPLTFHVSPELLRMLKGNLTPLALKRIEAIDDYTFTELYATYNRNDKNFSGHLKGDLEGFPVTAKLEGAVSAAGALTVNRTDYVALELDILPEPFNRLRDSIYGQSAGNYLILNTPTKVTLQLTKLDFIQKEFAATLMLDPLVAKNAETGELVNFPQMNGQLNLNGKNEFSLQFHAGNSDILITYKGLSNLKVRAILNQFHYGIFSDLITGDPLIRQRAEAVLGMELNGEITSSISSGSGYLNGIVHGSNGSIDLSAEITDDHITLRTPFVIQSKMSPELARTVLGPLLPFLYSALESDQNIVLQIQPDHFIAPLQAPDLKNINIGLGTLWLGRAQFKNSGAIESMLSILKPAASGVISVWFTPAYFSVNKGILSLQRLDMLVMQAYHLALWGDLNFVDETVNMKLGLAGAALNKAFKMPSPLTSDEMVAFPLRGPFGNASVDKGRAMTQIAGLIAKLQGTPQGFILGTFIQAAGKLGEEPIPPPTTTPFPWHSQELPEGESAPSKGGIGKPLKQVIKILGLGL